MASRVGILAVVLIALALSVFLWLRSSQPQRDTAQPAAVSDTPAAGRTRQDPDRSATKIHAHNLLLRKGPNFRVYVRWLDGQLARTNKRVNPSFDDPDSFYLDISTGVLRANIGDIGYFLNAGLTDSPLKNITLSADGDQLKMTGTLRKIVPLPIQLMGAVSVTEDNRIRVHVTKLSVLKLPLRGLMGAFKISLADFVKKPIAGMEIAGDDLLFDTQKLLPPPHIRGKLTKVRVDSPDLEEVYGNATQDVERVELWRNFLSLNGGTIDFGKLTMNRVDLIMIDISKDPWFDLDLVNYQAQLTNGFTRVTPESGLQIFMPDRRDLKAAPAHQDTNIEWFKNRNIPPPPQITVSSH